MRELRLEELTTEQKLGMVTIAYIRSDKPEEVDYVIERVKNHSVGAVWVQFEYDTDGETIKKIKEAADYPILIMSDAEAGIGDYMIGRHNAISCTGSTHLAYVFGKAIAVTARNAGYNVICNPVLDLISGNAVCGMTTRSLGGDKEKVTEYAMAIARGMHDGGVLTVGKHYPGRADVPDKFTVAFGNDTFHKTADIILGKFLVRSVAETL